MAACPPDKEKRVDKLLDIHDMWFGIGQHEKSEIASNIKKVTGTDTKYWKKFYDAEMKADFDYGDLPSMKCLRILLQRNTLIVLLLLVTFIEVIWIRLPLILIE